MKHRTKVTGNKRDGYEAKCRDCDWGSLGTYVLTREGMEQECQKHVLHAQRSQLFADLDAGEIDADEWRIRNEIIRQRLDEVAA